MIGRWTGPALGQPTKCLARSSTTMVGPRSRTALTTGVWQSRTEGLPVPCPLERESAAACGKSASSTQYLVAAFARGPPEDDGNGHGGERRGDHNEARHGEARRGKRGGGVFTACLCGDVVIRIGNVL
jgi:hypothetical protein